MGGLEAQVRRMADLAWAAGVLDARGSFLAYRRDKNVPGLVSPRIRVRTSQGNRDHLALLERILGGHSGTHGTTGRRRLEWQINGAKAVGAALDELLPYLRVQVRTAQLLRELCEEIQNPRSRPFDRRGLDHDEVIRRELFLTTIVSSAAPKL